MKITEKREQFEEQQFNTMFERPMNWIHGLFSFSWTS